jgi:hypothetical protein
VFSLANAAVVRFGKKVTPLSQPSVSRCGFYEPDNRRTRDEGGGMLVPNLLGGFMHRLFDDLNF